MKNLLLQPTIFLLIFTAFAGCKEKGVFAPAKEQIIGRWKYEKVKYQEQFSFENVDVTSDFEDFEIEFKNDHSLVRTNLLTGQEASGSWEIQDDFVYDEESPQAYQALTGWINDHNQTIDFYWENLAVTRKKISCTETDDWVTYRYTLKRK